MEGEMLSIKAIAAIKNITISELSEICGIPYERLLNLNLGRGVMTAKELIQISTSTGISPEKIKI